MSYALSPPAGFNTYSCRRKSVASRVFPTPRVARGEQANRHRVRSEFARTFLAVRISAYFRCLQTLLAEKTPLSPRLCISFSCGMSIIKHLVVHIVENLPNHGNRSPRSSSHVGIAPLRTPEKNGNANKNAPGGQTKTRHRDLACWVIGTRQARGQAVGDRHESF